MRRRVRSATYRARRKIRQAAGFVRRSVNRAELEAQMPHQDARVRQAQGDATGIDDQPS